MLICGQVSGGVASCSVVVVGQWQRGPIPAVYIRVTLRVEQQDLFLQSSKGPPDLLWRVESEHAAVNGQWFYYLRSTHSSHLVALVHTVV
jgi:hypothetical protein